MKKTILLFGMVFLLCYSKVFGAMPDKVFAPYVDVTLWPTFDLMTAYEATGQKYYTLAFIVSNSSGEPSWGSYYDMDEGFMSDQISELREVGGDIIISFGGASGTPIASSITSTESLVEAYETVIETYDVTWIDFDIEGSWVADDASIARRNDAAAILQSEYPDLRITYCLPVMPSGLTSNGVAIIEDAVDAGVDIYGVNVMAMDYGQSNSAMGEAAISAAENAYSQTGQNIGITPMIGQNDTQNEIFSLDNAEELLSFAQSTSWVNMLAMWSMGRDNGDCAGTTSASATCSGVTQDDYEFTSIFYAFTESSSDDNNDDDDDEEDTSAPTVSITSPSDGTELTENTTITISATASDSDGSITQVEFFSNNSSLGTDDSSPYSISWEDIAEGTYTLTAVATDNDGLTTTSSEISVTVSSDSGDDSSDDDDSDDDTSDTCWTEWTEGSYTGGSQVSYNGINYQAKWWTDGVPGEDDVWEDMGECSGSTETETCWTEWSEGSYTGGSQVSYNGVNYQAKWWTDGVPGEDDVWQNMGECSDEKSTNLNSGVISDFSLKILPNPADYFAVVSFTLEESELVNVTVFNITGEKTNLLKEESLSKGSHQITLNTSSLPSGMYLLNLDTKNGSVTKKLIIK